MRDAVFLWVMNLEDCPLSTSSFSSGSSKVRLATVLTDMPLESKRERLECLCGSCTICRDACPAGAISGEIYVPGAPRDTIFDARKCSEHMKTYKDIGRGAVCGICMSVCPYNKR